MVDGKGERNRNRMDEIKAQEKTHTYKHRKQGMQQLEKKKWGKVNERKEEEMVCLH